MNEKPLIIDALQFNNWSEDIFRQMQEGGVTGVHVTISYHEDFRETVENIIEWNRFFEKFHEMIMPAKTVKDLHNARRENRTAVIFGCQNSSPIEDDIGLVEVLHQLGIRFMQLSYNNQSLLATGCYETLDAGITRMGKQVIREMNRVGMVVDMSHSAERSTLEAIELSKRPIAITHANPSFWHPALRNKSDIVLKALAENEGMLGFSLYPYHLKNGSGCTLESFCEMVARTVEMIGIQYLGIGSDLCQNQPDSVVEWMRNGSWNRETDYGEGTKNEAGFPDQPQWFRDNRDFIKILDGLSKVGFTDEEVKQIVGMNWMRFMERSFEP